MFRRFFRIELFLKIQNKSVKLFPDSSGKLFPGPVIFYKNFSEIIPEIIFWNRKNVHQSPPEFFTGITPFHI